MLAKDDDCFRCHCCGGLPEGGMDQNLIDLLNEIGIIAEDIEEPHCGYRCRIHNAEVGGERNSQHLYGTAVDAGYKRFGSMEKLARLAEEAGADGVGRYEEDGFVHIDVRSGRIGDDYRW